MISVSLEDLHLGSRRFDKVLALRVGIFHREPGRARKLIEPWLAPGAVVITEYDLPPVWAACRLPSVSQDQRP